MPELTTMTTLLTLGDGGATLGATAPPVAGRPGAAPAATEGQPLGSAPGGQAPPPNPFGGGFMFLLLGLMFVMIMMTVFSGRKEKKRRAEMLSSLRRHDRVQTIGGILGSVAEVRDDEIVLKVDEATNTKIRVAKSAVQSVLKKSPSEETASAESDR